MQAFISIENIIRWNIFKYVIHTRTTNISIFPYQTLEGYMLFSMTLKYFFRTAPILKKTLVNNWRIHDTRSLNITICLIRFNKKNYQKKCTTKDFFSPNSLITLTYNYNVRSITHVGKKIKIQGAWGCITLSSIETTISYHFLINYNSASLAI